MAQLYLASSSPRRRELLTQIGLPFHIVPASIDETPEAGELAYAYVERLARSKALAGLNFLAQRADVCVLGADTAVVLDGRVPHGMLLEIFTRRGAGTLIRRK